MISLPVLNKTFDFVLTSNVHKISRAISRLKVRLNHPPPPTSSSSPLMVPVKTAVAVGVGLGEVVVFSNFNKAAT